MDWIASLTVREDGFFDLEVLPPRVGILGEVAYLLKIAGRSVPVGVRLLRGCSRTDFGSSA